MEKKMAQEHKRFRGPINDKEQIYGNYKELRVLINDKSRVYGNNKRFIVTEMTK
jgi:hypothetical protein